MYNEWKLVVDITPANSKTAKFTTPRCTEPCTRSFDEIFFSDWTCLIKLSPETDCVFLIYFFYKRKKLYVHINYFGCPFFLIHFPHVPTNWNSFWRIILITEIQQQQHNVRNTIWMKKNRASDNGGKIHSFLMCRTWIY